MSATLTWASSGLNTAKTGTSFAAMMNDLDTKITSFSANPAFFWRKSGKVVAGNTQYLLLERKDGSAGRIAIMNFTGAADYNRGIFETQPAGDIYIAWFPNGSGTTLSNLTTPTGTMCGNDTNCVMCSPIPQPAAISYTAPYRGFYYDSAEAMIFCWADPTAIQTYMFAAGNLVVDGADVAYGATMGTGNSNLASFGSTNSSPWVWIANPTGVTAGATQSAIRTNYGSVARIYGQAFVPSGSWASQAIGPLDVLTDTSINKVGFIPCPLMATGIKCEGTPIKLRQMVWGPSTTGPFVTYQTSGPTVQARQIANTTAGSSGAPWLTNFKI